MDSDRFLTSPITAALAVVVITAILLTLFFPKNGKGGKPFPPLAPASMLETMSKMQGNDLPWFYLKTAEVLNNYTYRLQLPLPQMFVVTGDPKLAREVLTDPKTTKPALYKQFEAEGIGNIFTRNGAFWVSRTTEDSSAAMSATVSSR